MCDFVDILCFLAIIRQYVSAIVLTIGYLGILIDEEQEQEQERQIQKLALATVMVHLWHAPVMLQ